LVTTSVMGPAPKLRGDTETRSSEMDAVTVIGEGGRGLFS
jgi:hypothetical protein